MENCQYILNGFVHLCSLEIKSISDYAILLGIIGVTVFYFGKIIGEVRHTKENNYVNYIAGSIFVLFTMCVPIIFLNVLSKKSIIVLLNKDFAIIILLLVTLLMAIKYAKYSQEKLGLKETYFEITGNLIKKWFKRVFTSGYAGKFTLFVIANIVIWSFWSVLSQTTNLIAVILAIITTIYIYNTMAIVDTWTEIKQHYPAIIHLMSGKSIKGNLIKIEEGFINVCDKNNIYHCIENNIEYIEKKIVKPKK